MFKMISSKKPIMFFIISIFLLGTSLSASFLEGAELMDEDLVRVSSIFSFDTAESGKSYSAAVIADIIPGWHINSFVPYESWLIAAKVEFDTVAGITPHSIKYPPAEDEYLSGEKFSVYSDKAVFSFNIDIAKNLENGEYVLPIKLTYQPCNNKECRAPQTVDADLRINVGEKGNRINKSIFADIEISNQSTKTTVESDVSKNEIQELIDEYGFWGYFIALGLAFLTGLVLSFSPCTYPMVPITVSIFAGQSRSMGRGFIMSLFYVGSMALVYGLMGMIVAKVGGVFGAWLASPPVVIGIVIVFVVFALSMFGLYELNIPMSLRQKLGSKVKGGGGIMGAIILGFIAALVVSPCVGPFVAGILLYIAASGSPLIGFLVLFVFAIGLGTLYIIIGTFSSAINQLPNSGEWMESVKKFFGFVLILMALYFLSTIISVTMTALLTSILLLSLGIFGGGLDRLTAESCFFPRLKKFIGYISLVIGTYLLIGVIVTEGLILPPMSQSILTNSPEYSQNKKLIDWETDLETGLALAEKVNKPVIIDTWATWCANCKVLDKKVFGNQDVANEAKRFFPIKVQLETADSPQTKAFMERFDLKHYSLPTTLILDSEGNVKKIIQGVMDADDFIAELKKVS